eukprot:COSAG06_NODE_7036_length_2664_cov_2.313840_2_plen_241_part_00
MWKDPTAAVNEEDYVVKSSVGRGRAVADSGLGVARGLTQGVRVIDELSASMVRAGQRKVVDGVLQSSKPPSSAEDSPENRRQSMSEGGDDEDEDLKSTASGGHPAAAGGGGGFGGSTHRPVREMEPSFGTTGYRPKPAAPHQADTAHVSSDAGTAGGEDDSGADRVGPIVHSSDEEEPPSIDLTDEADAQAEDGGASHSEPVVAAAGGEESSSEDESDDGELFRVTTSSSPVIVMPIAAC